MTKITLKMGMPVKDSFGTVYEVATEVVVDSERTIVICIEPVSGQYKGIQYGYLIVPEEKPKFKIGDTVEAVYFGHQGFVGTVMGFEQETGRVICKSTKTGKTDRARYSYLPTEIEKTSIHIIEHGTVFNFMYKQMAYDVHVIKSPKRLDFYVKAPRDGVVWLDNVALHVGKAYTLGNMKRAIEPSLHSIVDRGLLI